MASAVRIWAHRAPLGLLLLAAGAPLHAETLQEALAAAYRTNPTLSAARAGAQASDENIAIEKAYGRPNATTSASYTETLYQRPASLFNADRAVQAQGTLSVPLYQGGTVRNAVAAARKRAQAGQFDLAGTELTVFSQVVGAYMDVIRDEAIVGLSLKNVDVLEVNLRATNDRFQVGDLTRTDVAQSESRLAVARSQLEQARAQLITSRENYIKLIGHAPVDLQPPPALPGLPASADAAVAVALASNPDLASAHLVTQSRGYDVRAAQGLRAPTLSGVASGSYYDDLKSAAVEPGTTRDVSVGVRLTLPIYQGGLPGARVRQARDYQSQAMEQEIAVERNLIAQTRSLYSSWLAYQAVTESSRKAVSSADLSLEGVRAENSVGTRTILDILNAEQEAFSARVDLVTAQRNAYVAGFSLLAAMGKADARALSLDAGPLYDPMVAYRRASSSIWDWSDGPAPKPMATRTIDSPPQNATVSDTATP